MHQLYHHRLLRATPQLSLEIGNQELMSQNQLMARLQISCYHIAADRGEPRATHLIMAVNTTGTTTQSQCWEHNAVKTPSRCVATPGAHTTIFLWPQCRIAGQHNRLFRANCAKFNLNWCQNMATQQDISVRFCEVATMYNYTTEYYKW